MNYTQVIHTQDPEDSQRSLFADLDPVQAPPRLLQKAVAAIHSYAINGPYNLYTRRVSNALTVLALGHWRLLSEAEQREILEKRIVLKFRCTVGDIRRCMHVDPKDQNYGRIHSALDALYRLEFRFDVMADLEGEPAWTVNSRLISQWARAKDGSGRVEWEYPPDVFQMLIQPSRYAMLNMFQANSFKTAPGLALFENTVRYINNPAHLTSRRTVEDWVRLLANKPDLYLKEYRYFKRYVLTPAMEELNEIPQCPITVSLLETKGARGKVTHLQFKVELKSQRPLITEISTTGPSSQIVAELKALRLGDTVINRLLVSMEDKELRLCLDRLKARLRKPPEVKNMAGLFLSYCNEVMNPLEPHSELAPDTAIAAPALPTPSRPEEDALRREELQAEFYLLSPPEQGEWLEKFKEAKKSSSLLQEKLAAEGLSNVLVNRNFFVWLADNRPPTGLVSAPKGDSPGG